MTGERHPPSNAAAWVAVGLTFLLVLGDVGDKYWGTASDGRVTSWQVGQLTDSVKKLTDKLDGLVKQAALDALASRVDTHEGKIADLYNLTTGLRHDLDNRLPPPIYRNPR